jgi:hypothetical protein
LKVPKTGGIPTTKASVLRWLKREGDPVQAGEAVVELETEKVSYELESPIAGTLLKILASWREVVPYRPGGRLCAHRYRGNKGVMRWRKKKRNKMPGRIGLRAAGLEMNG